MKSKGLSHNNVINMKVLDQLQGPSLACNIGREPPLNRAVTKRTKKGKAVENKDGGKETIKS